MKPDPTLITLHDNIPRIEQMLMELIIRPRRDLIKWARFTKQTPNIKIGYPGQHLASLVTGVEGARTAARGHDLCDGSEVKSCSRVDQLDKCKSCKAAVARIEPQCPQCDSPNIKRKNDSKWLLAIRSEKELNTLLDEVPRIVFIISDYPYYERKDWETLRFQVFEIWPKYSRHCHFRTLMKNYFQNIYLPHIAKNPNKTPAPKNFWPYSFQFFMCNPVRTFHCIVEDALKNPQLTISEYVAPTEDRAMLEPLPMPLSILRRNENQRLLHKLDCVAYKAASTDGLNAEQRLQHLTLRDTDHASPQTTSYRRGIR